MASANRTIACAISAEVIRDLEQSGARVRMRRFAAAETRTARRAGKSKGPPGANLFVACKGSHYLNDDQVRMG